MRLPITNAYIQIWIGMTWIDIDIGFERVSSLPGQITLVYMEG